MGISRFDKRVSFTATEIACLINGLDPANIASDRPSRSDYEVLRLASENALNHAIDESRDDSVVIVKQYKFLYSTLLEKWLNPKRSDSNRFLGDSHQIRYVMICQQKIFPKFDELFFSRKEVIRYLNELGYESVYAFDGDKKMNNHKPVPADKPLGTRERDTLLVIIAALCKDAGYDYTKAAKTAGLICTTVSSMVDKPVGETTIEGKLKKIPVALETSQHWITTIEGHLKKIPDALATRMK